MSLVHAKDDFNDIMNSLADAYNSIQDGNYVSAVSSVIQSDLGSSFIIFSIVPLIVSIVGIIFAFISCCYMCCCNNAKTYAKQQAEQDKIIQEMAAGVNLNPQKGDDVVQMLLDNPITNEQMNKIQFDMDGIKDNSYAKAKRCLTFSWVCNFIFIALSIIYCIGLIFMQISVGKLGKTLPEEKTMLDTNLQKVIDVIDSYSIVLDSSLHQLNITQVNLLQELFTQTNGTLLNQTIDQFFDDLRNLQPLNIIVQDLQTLYANQQNKDLSSVLRNILYYQQYNDGVPTPDFITQGQNGIDQIENSLNYLNTSLDTLNQNKESLQSALNNVKNLLGDVDISSIDVPTFNEILQQIGNETVQNIILELMDTGAQQLQRVMIQIKQLLQDFVPYQFLVDELIPWTENNGQIEDLPKQDILQIIKQEFDVDLTNITQFMTDILTDDVVQQVSDGLYEVNGYFLQLRHFKDLSFNEFFNELVSSDENCTYIWCGVISEDSYNSFVSTIQGLPLLSIDKDDPQSLIDSVTIILSILILLIPVIFIFFVFLSQCCCWKCCNCFNMVFTPFCALFTSLVVFLLVFLSVPQVTVVPVADMVTTDINELTVSLGDFLQKVAPPEDLNQYLVYNLDVSSADKYVEFKQNNQQVDVLTIDLSSFNVSQILSDFDYTVQGVYNLEDQQLNASDDMLNDILDLLPNVKQYTIVLNNILDKFQETIINLNMENSSINQLFSPLRQSIVGLIKFGTLNPKDLFNQMIQQGLNYTFDKDISTEDGLKGYLTLDRTNINSTADNIQQELIPIDSLTSEIDNTKTTLMNAQCTIDDANQQVNDATRMLNDDQRKNVTIFDDVTSFLGTPEGDNEGLADACNDIINNMEGIIDLNDIYNNSVKTIENLYSNILYEYYQAQGNNIAEIQSPETPSEYIYNNTVSMRQFWLDLSLTDQVQVNDVLNLSGFDDYLAMYENPQQSLCITENDTINDIFQHEIPTWWNNILSQRNIEITNDTWNYQLLFSYCKYIGSVNDQLKSAQSVLNVSSNEELKSFIYNAEDYISQINTTWGALKGTITSFENEIYNEQYICQDQQGQIDPDYTPDQDQHLATDIDNWVQGIFRSVVNNIAETFNTQETSEMPLIKPILVQSDLYSYLPDLGNEAIDQILDQFVNNDSLANTQILNTGVTLVTDQVVLLSGPFNTMALGAYLCTIFGILAPFVACCGYKALYLKGFEKKRVKQLGKADPYEDEQSGKCCSKKQKSSQQPDKKSKKKQQDSGYSIVTMNHQQSNSNKQSQMLPALEMQNYDYEYNFQN